MKSCCDSGVGKVAYVLVLIGALNWGLTAIGFNLVNMLFGSMPGIETTIYALVGISAVYMIVMSIQSCGK